MGVFLLHRNEWIVILVLLIVLVSTRITNIVEESKIRSKNEDEAALYKDTHQAELVKEWVTSQYCKTDLDILCPSSPPTTSCYAAFDPPLRFVLDLTDKPEEQPTDCRMTELLKDIWEEHHENVEDMDGDDLLTSLIAHVMKQVRSKSINTFRADDRSILEFEQSRLIELSLASFLDLFSSPTRQDEEGKILATKATEFGLTKHIWSRSEVLKIMDDAVMYHTHHKRHGSTEAGAAARVSRQQPSFVFKYLPLVKEQIENLEYDTAVERRLRKLYPFALLDEQQQISLDGESPESETCLWSHFQEGSLISEDCILALDTAPLKIRDLDWEGNFSFVLIHIYTALSGAFLLWLWSRSFSKSEQSKKTSEAYALLQSHPGQDAVIFTSSNPSETTTSYHQPTKDACDKRIRSMQKVCLAYLILSCMVGVASSYSSETIRFSDFLDGLCLAMLGFLTLHLAPITSPDGSNAKRKRKLYHKDSSAEWSSDEAKPASIRSLP